MRLELPRVDPAVRAAEETPSFWLRMVPVWLAVLALPCIPGFTEATDVDEVEGLIIVVSHMSLATVLVLPPLRGPADGLRVRALYLLAPAVIITLTCLMVYFTEDPGSAFWAFNYLYMGVMAAAFLPGSSLLPALASLGPLATAAAFRAQGHGWTELAMPLFSAAAAPALYLVLARPAHRARLARQERARLRPEGARARMDHERLRLLAQVGASVGGALAGVERDASRAAVAGVPRVESARVLERARAALRELRAAVWSLDPDDSPWSTLEPHLRRMAAELAAPRGCAVEASLPGDALLTAPSRMALWRAVRLLEDACGPARLVVRAEGGRLWVLVDRGDGGAERVSVGALERVP